MKADTIDTHSHCHELNHVALPGHNGAILDQRSRLRTEGEQPLHQSKVGAAAFVVDAEFVLRVERLQRFVAEGLAGADEGRLRDCLGELLVVVRVGYANFALSDGEAADADP